MQLRFNFVLCLAAAFLISGEVIGQIDSSTKSLVQESVVSSLNLSVNRVSALQSKYPQYKGNGIVISIKESLFDSLDFDIKGRTIESGISSSVPSLHATDMATIIGGGGNLSVKSMGVAPQITVTSADFNDSMSDPNSLLTS